mmetsp:Transcript_3062/g.5793  ORF Transcript_3062/g.5793 Transcript_3062/m.5793 type:complete len:82 (+) Transcript_3062:965-1210(+)
MLALKVNSYPLIPHLLRLNPSANMHQMKERSNHDVEIQAKKFFGLCLENVLLRMTMKSVLLFNVSFKTFPTTNFNKFQFFC